MRATAEAAAALAGCAPGLVCASSTGVIGEPLPVGKIVAALPGLHAALGPDGWAAAAEAIMTTDTFPKAATARAEIDGREVMINGIAKGSGMIAPDMATMLAYVATDAALPAPVLRALLKPAADRSFNAITVDGDMSTSDTVLLFATGAVPVDPPPAGRGGRRLAAFRAALEGGDARSRAADRARRRGREQVRRGHGGPAPPARARRGASPSPSPTRRWSRPRWPARTPTGAGS